METDTDTTSLHLISSPLAVDILFGSTLLSESVATHSEDTALRLTKNDFGVMLFHPTDLMEVSIDSQNRTAFSTFQPRKPDFNIFLNRGPFYHPFCDTALILANVTSFPDWDCGGRKFLSRLINVFVNEFETSYEEEDEDLPEALPSPVHKIWDEVVCMRVKWHKTQALQRVQRFEMSVTSLESGQQVGYSHLLLTVRERLPGQAKPITLKL